MLLCSSKENIYHYFAIIGIYILLNYTVTCLTFTETIVYLFNQGFVISPRTGVLHACLSVTKLQNLTTLASGENLFLFRIHLKDYKSGLITWENKWEVELNRPILVISDRAKMSALFQLTHTFKATWADSPQPHAEDRLTIFFSQHGVARVEISSRVMSLSVSWKIPDYSRLLLSRIPRDSLKYFKISVPRHIRFAELRKK